MKWEQARQILFSGKSIWRKVWAPECLIFANPERKFITLKSIGWTQTDWKPYIKDLDENADDWEEFTNAVIQILWNGKLLEPPESIKWDSTFEYALELAVAYLCIEYPNKMPSADQFKVIKIAATIGLEDMFCGLIKGIAPYNRFVIVPKTPF